MTAFDHVTVLRDEAVRALAPRAGETHVDCTLGGGGHAEALLEAADCRVVGIDRDPAALAAASERLARFGERFVAVRGRFGDLDRLLAPWSPVDGVLADLGVSSPQLDEGERGFSFRKPGPLDMRMDPAAELTAAEIVNTWSEERLGEILRDLGEERRWSRVARAVVAGRPWSDTVALADAIGRAVGGKPGRIHPATRSFQAIRIAVNDELGELERLLPAAVDHLAPCGRLAVISFHSLEDRMVKRFLARESGREAERDPYGHPIGTFRLARPAPDVTPPPSDPNPRARSARLRSAVRLPCPAR